MKFIIFHDKKVKRISDKQSEKIFEVSSQSDQKGIRFTDGDYIAFSSIARIVNEKQYYQENPNDRPAPEYKSLPELQEASGIMDKPWRVAKRYRNLESMLSGYVHAKDGMHGADWLEVRKSDMLYQKMTGRLERMKAEEELK